MALFTLFRCQQLVPIYGTILIVTFSPIIALMFSSYPFLVGEESGIDPLYRIVNIPVKDVVKGRYLTSFVFILCSLLVGSLLATLASFMFPVDGFIKDLFLSSISTFLMISFIVFIQYPFFFKYGYAKGKMISTIPFLLIGITTIISDYFSDSLRKIMFMMMENTTMTFTVVLIVCSIVAFNSYWLSTKIYAKKDF